MRVAVYIRVSLEENKKQSIEEQFSSAKEYSNLYQLPIIQWYKDVGTSGTISIDQRKEGYRLLKDAQNNLFDILLVHRLNRLGQTFHIIFNAVRELELCGIRVRSITEPFDTADPSGQFLLNILKGVGSFKQETVFDRMKVGTNRAAQQGKWLGGIVPYGYRIDKTGYLIISDQPSDGFEMSEADVIRLIYRAVGIQGLSTYRVADYLNALRVPPSCPIDETRPVKGKRKINTSRKWIPGRIRNIIVNTTYKGIHYFGKRSKKERELIMREVPAIISEELWEKAQNVLKKNQIQATRNARRQYLLRGLITCGICGLKYYGVAYPSTGGKPKLYYRCGGKQRYRGIMGIEKCPNRNVSALWLEEQVWNDIISIAEKPGTVLVRLAKHTKEEDKDINNLINEKKIIGKNLGNKEGEKQAILDLYRRGVVKISDVEVQIQTINRECEHLSNKIIEVDKKILKEKNAQRAYETTKDLLLKIKKMIADNPSYKNKQDIITSLIEKITIEEQMIILNYKFFKRFITF